MICRIFHKTGEKKNTIFQGHAYLGGSNSLPALMESQTTLLESQSHPINTNPFLVHHHHQESNELKALINPVVAVMSDLSSPLAFPINSGFQSCSFSTPPPTTTTATAAATIPKQCKTEANFNFSSHFQLPPPDAASMHWVDRIHSNLLHQHPLFFEMDYCTSDAAAAASGFTGGGDSAAAAADTTVHEMSTSIAFNRAGFQMMVDLPIRVPGAESWPLDP